MNQVCRVCGRPFEGHFNAKVCGEDCRSQHRRKYERSWKDENRKPPVARASIPPFPAGMNREVFGPWLSGFADGEATFGLRCTWVKDRGRDNLMATFRIAVRDDDAEVLRLIRSYWQCGIMNFSDNRRSKIANAKPIAIYSVQCVADLAGVVIPHFERYPLLAKKRSDFAIWRKGVELMAEVQSRPMLPNFGVGGTLPRWAVAEREEFRSLSERLVDSRAY